MATLHVRNVPEDVYERLRAAAAEDGRSIGAEATALLRRALVERGEQRQGLERALVAASPFKQRLANRARPLVLRAQQLAQAGGATETTPAHVLQAMLEDDVLRATLERGGVSDESVNAALPPPAKPRETPPPVSAEARTMLEQALVQALGL
jgi:plasmid stability protein